MLYALKFFDTERSLWYLDCVHRSKPFLKRREKKFLKRGIKTTISKWYGIQCLTAFGHKRQNMTVEELINELSKVDDKTMEVNFPYSHGTQENGQPLNADSVSVFDDCVVIY